MYVANCSGSSDSDMGFCVLIELRCPMCFILLIMIVRIILEEYSLVWIFFLLKHFRKLQPGACSAPRRDATLLFVILHEANYWINRVDGLGGESVVPIPCPFSKAWRKLSENIIYDTLKLYYWVTNGSLIVLFFCHAAPPRRRGGNKRVRG